MKYKKRMLFRKEKKERMNVPQLKRETIKEQTGGAEGMGGKKERERKLERGMNREMPRRVKPGVCSREGTRESREEREGKKGEREE